MITLNDLKPGENAIVTEIDSALVEDGYLMEMGIMAGTAVRFIKRAPLGDPIQVNLRGYNLSISRSKAKSIFVTKG